MDRVTEFLLQRISEDEASARSELEFRAINSLPPSSVTGYHHKFDPARILAECAAKRKIVSEWSNKRDEWMARFDRSADELHQDWMHPSFKYVTVTTRRKSHDDDSPVGEGWERNLTSRDSDGWEALESTEESYWRRLRPEGPKDVSASYPPPFHIKCLALPYADHADYLPDWAETLDSGSREAAETRPGMT